MNGQQKMIALIGLFLIFLTLWKNDKTLIQAVILNKNTGTTVTNSPMPSGTSLVSAAATGITHGMVSGLIP